MEELALFGAGEMAKQQVMKALEEVNCKVAARGHLALSGEELTALVGRCDEILRETSRVEFGQGVLPGLVFAFCDSPHIPPGGFAATLERLMACFYHFKNESAERLGDDELLVFMKEHFDGVCQGSVEYLEGSLLEWLARDARFAAEGAEDREAPDAENPDGEGREIDGE